MPKQQIGFCAGYATAILGMAITSTWLMTGCQKASIPQKDAVTPQVTVMEVTSLLTSDHDEYVGRLEATATVEVHSRVYGFIKTVEFQDGDMVQEGQLLYTIEPDEYEAIHKQTLSKVTVWETKWELAKSKLARTEKLLTSGASTREDYEEALATERESAASIVAAKTDADRAALDLKYTHIKSPVTGRIDRTQLTPGNLVTGGVNSGTMLTRIVKIDPIYAYFDVDERSLLRYQAIPTANDKANTTAKSQAPLAFRDKEIPCRIQLADESNFPHLGKLDFFENRLNSGTGTLRVRGIFTNTDRRMSPGMFVRVQIPVSQEYSAIAIPEVAISADQSVKYVYVVTPDNLVKRQDVELGGKRGALRIIRSGLKPKERVIIKGQQRVRPDQKVEAEVENPVYTSATPDDASAS